MPFTVISPAEITANPFSMLYQQWALVTVRSPQGSNPMTVSWGGVGIIWNKPVATLYIRPQRYTHELLEQEDCFTISFYPESCRDALKLCGSKSGREMDKAAAAGLTPVEQDGFCFYEEAELVLCCKKIYKDTIKPAGFLSPEVAANYPAQDYHDVYLGEIVKVLKKV